MQNSRDRETLSGWITPSHGMVELMKADKRFGRVVVPPCSRDAELHTAITSNT